MKQAWKTMLALLGSTGAWLLARAGGWDAPLRAMFILMALDVFTGTLCALWGKSGRTAGGGFLSRAMFEGLARKMMMVGMVMLAVELDNLAGTQGVSRAAVIGFYAVNEGMSAVENAALLGVPFPQRVLSAMEALKKDGEGRP